MNLLSIHAGSRRSARWLSAAALIGLGSLVQAQTVTVDTAVDAVDIDWTTATVADLPGPDGKVSFAEAMIATNNTPGHQTVHFAIPQNEWILQGIYPGRAVLKPATSNFFFRSNDDITVDGRTQTAFTGDTNPDGAEVVIFGTDYFLNGDNSSIFGFDSTAIFLTGSNGVVQENTLGNISLWNGSGSLVQGNTPNVIAIDRSSQNVVIGNVTTRVRVLGFAPSTYAVGNRIGGPTLAERNIIKGYGTWNSEGLPNGSTVQLFDTRDTLLENNWIGMKEDGLTQGSQASTMGIEFTGSNIDTLVKDNRIAGIRGLGQGPHWAGFVFGHAVLIGGTGSGITLHGNIVGLNAAGQSLPSVWGLDIGHNVFSTISDITIGGPNPGEGNEVAGHTLNGVTVGWSVSGVRVSGNSIHDNGWLGIDLARSGAVTGQTPNDALDADTGGNGLQNYPDIASATATVAGVQVAGTLDTSPNGTFTLEFFASPSCDGSGYGEGTTFLGSAVVSTDAGGHAIFAANLPAAVPAGWVVTSTATDEADGSTSEFSACVALGAGIGTNYCTAAANSTGSGATIGAYGSASIGANDFGLSCGPLPNQPGLFYYGPNQISAPFGDGFRCVGGSTTRLNPVVFVQGGQAARPVDVVAEGFLAGQSVNFQFWYRDPAAAGTGFNLSDGLAVTFAP